MKIERRGRPKSIETLTAEGVAQQRKFIREYVHKDGTKDIWTYDLDKNPSGPVSVEFIYPKNFIHISDQFEDSHLPLTKRTWVNPANGKEVGYTRAKNLGLI